MPLSDAIAAVLRKNENIETRRLLKALANDKGEDVREAASYARDVESLISPDLGLRSLLRRKSVPA